MPSETELALTNYAGKFSQSSLAEYQIIRYKVYPSVNRNMLNEMVAKEFSIRLSSPVAGQTPVLAGIKQDMEDQRAKDSDLRPLAQVSTAPHIFFQRIHRAPGSFQP